MLSAILFFNITPSSLDSLYRPLYIGETWLIVYAASYSSGLALRHRRPTHAAAILNWILKPSLLLAILLYTTVGLCLNGYAFSLDPRVPLASVLVPAAGYGSVYTAAVLLDMVDRLRDAAAGRHGRRRRLSSRRHERRRLLTTMISRETIATESAMCNCLLALVMMKISLNDPDSDVASAVALWMSVMSVVPPVVAWMPAVLRQCYATWKKNRRTNRSTFDQLIVISKMPCAFQRVNIAFGLNDSMLKRSSKPSSLSLAQAPAAATRNIRVERVTVV